MAEATLAGMACPGNSRRTTGWEGESEEVNRLLGHLASLLSGLDTRIPEVGYACLRRMLEQRLGGPVSKRCFMEALGKGDPIHRLGWGRGDRGLRRFPRDIEAWHNSD